MPPKELGTKHTCFKCGTKFYDMKKPEPLCPKCGTDQRQSPATKPSATAERRRAAKPPPPVEPEAAEEAEADVEEADEAEAEEDEAEDDEP